MRWVIGDIHGMLAPLEALVTAIDRVDSERQLMFVGDYVNRGPDSKHVIDLLLSLSEAHFVRGNHDDVFDECISTLSYCGTPGEEQRVQSFQWFMQHGLDKTFFSYGVEPRLLKATLKDPSGRALDDLAALVPSAHRQFIRNLPVVLETPDMFVAHAKWDIYTPTVTPPLSERLLSKEMTRYNLLWGRYPIHEVEAEKAWERTGYFGHTPVDTYREGDGFLPVVGPKIILLDTAVALAPDGRLTAVCHENGTFLQSDPSGKMVTPDEKVTDLPSHRLKIALIRPQIAPNTGNIARLCVATGTELHLARPLGFVLSDKELKRSAMDYWPRLKLAVHDDEAALFRTIGADRAWMLSSKATHSLWDADFADGDWLIFGNETHGLPAETLDRDRTHAIRIPQAPNERCLNLSTAAGIALYTALHRLAPSPFGRGLG